MMNKLKIIILFIPLILSCQNKDSKMEIAKWDNEKSVSEVKEIKNDGKVSYWFVLVNEKKNGLMLNSFIKIDQPYFSSEKALSHFGNPKDYFLIFFKEIHKETYEKENN